MAAALRDLGEVVAPVIGNRMAFSGAFNAGGIATARGARWYASTVRNVLAQVGKLGRKDAA